MAYTREVKYGGKYSGFLARYKEKGEKIEKGESKRKKMSQSERKIMNKSVRNLYRKELPTTF